MKISIRLQSFNVLLIVIIIFCCWGFKVHAQNGFTTITGKIVDADTKEVLPFASIYIKGQSIGTTSNLDGSFVFHIPSKLLAEPVIISMIGYETVEKEPASFTSNTDILLKPNTLQLKEVVVSSEKPPTAREIVKMAYKAIPDNYPSEPYILEGFVRDLQKEDDRYVELLEYAAKFSYAGYKFYPKVELQEVRKSFEVEKHPWNKENEQQNSINDLLEDDFIKYGFSFIKGAKRWKYEIESILPFNNSAVYKIVGVNSPFEKVVLFIDVNSYAFVRIELDRSKHKNRYYKRRFTNGQQEAHYTMIFEYQKINGKMYLKYQKEEDDWDIFKGLESKKLLLKQNFKKELFVNRVVTEDLENYQFTQNLQRTETIEAQAKPYNEDFWKHYNAPAQTSSESKILEELEKSNIKIK